MSSSLVSDRSAMFQLSQGISLSARLLSIKIIYCRIWRPYLKKLFYRRKNSDRTLISRDLLQKFSKAIFPMSAASEMTDGPRLDRKPNANRQFSGIFNAVNRKHTDTADEAANGSPVYTARHFIPRFAERKILSIDSSLFFFFSFLFFAHRRRQGQSKNSPRLRPVRRREYHPNSTLMTMELIFHVMLVESLSKRSFSFVNQRSKSRYSSYESTLDSKE